MWARPVFGDGRGPDLQMPDKGKHCSCSQEVVGLSTALTSPRPGGNPGPAACKPHGLRQVPVPPLASVYSIVQRGGRMSNWGKCVGQPLALGGARPQESLLFVGKPVLPPKDSPVVAAGYLVGKPGKKGTAGCINPHNATCPKALHPCNCPGKLDCPHQMLLTWR